jgi:YfiH family protein
MLSPIQADCLSIMPGIRHGFFTRQGGVSTGIYRSLNCGAGSKDDPVAVIENRARVAEHLGSPGGDVQTVYQIHSDRAVIVDSLIDRNELPKADALVTATRGLAIGILTADCAPVLLADGEARIVAAAHAGWRGAVGGIIESTIKTMIELGARRENIRAAVGPCINQPSYEVGPEFEAELLAADKENARFFTTPATGKRAHFDLPAFVHARLVRAGIGIAERESPCTYRNESLFFSYRRSQHAKEADYGRQISAIAVI